MAEPKTYFVCDPDKNKLCRKTNCHINGGPCTSTTRLEFAKQPVKTVRLVIPVEKTDMVDFGLVEDDYDGSK